MYELPRRKVELYWLNEQNDYTCFLISGDFFLAELIEAQDEKNKCVVADVS